ncbi:MAG: hypothetical protein JW797_10545 [Bradymonadales bacterium]|nr:hypothetical protein [Bradymonadales bacterium]
MSPIPDSSPRIRKKPWFTLIATLAIVLLILLFSSFRQIEPGEAGIRVNRLTGNEKLIDKPGLVVDLPLFHDLYIVDTSPQTLRLEGTTISPDTTVIPRLTVRANDGSNFWFERLTIQYEVITDQAITVLHERGEGTAFREWMVPAVRSVLRDEFGRQSTRDVSNPATYTDATAEAQAQLNTVLNPHGIRVLNVDTPEPRFNPQYETTIEQRNQANNQLRVIEEELTRARTERERRLAQVDQARNATYQQRRAEQEGNLRQFLADQERRLAQAQANLTRMEGQAQAIYNNTAARADELRQQMEAEIGRTQAQINALQTNSTEAVMRQLARRLEGIRIQVLPYRHDATPETIRLDGNQAGGVR